MPAPGTVNFTEGQVTLNGQSLPPYSTHAAAVSGNQVLETRDGKAEVLLTPGVFFRLGENSAMRMISTKLEETRVDLLHGTGMLEVTDHPKESDLTVGMAGSQTMIEKPGLYGFNAERGTVSALDGRATVYRGNKHAEVTKGSELVLTQGKKLKSHDLDVKVAERDSLYRWSKLRSDYDAQANADVAQTVYAEGGANWYGAGWYWDPYWDFYAFLPGDGLWYSPFGWGFYSPGFIGQYGYYGRYGFGGRGVAHAGQATTAFRGASAGGFRGGFSGGGMRGGGFGGFHGGGGGRR
jgi:hypothetical protein